MNHILKRKFHKKGYIINGVFAGTSLVEGTEVSGFSSVNNYILVPAIPANTTNFEIFLKVKFSNVATNQHFFNSSYTYSFLLSINTSGKLFTHISSNGTSWDIASNIQGVSTLSKDVWYYIKCSFNGSEYKIQLSSDNKIWTDEITIQSTVSLASVGGGRIGSGWYDTPGTYITCDFSQCYININGQRWWDGLKRCKYDFNFNVTGTPNISNPPSCEVSGFSTANYLSLPENFIPNSTDFECVFKLKTSGHIQQWFFNTSPWYSFLGGIHSSGVLNIYLSSNASSWNVVSDLRGKTVLDLNTWYYVKYTYDGETYNVYLSKDKVDWSLEISLDSTLSPGVGTSNGRIGCGWTDNPAINTTIDLTQSYIKINGELWWSCFKKTENVVYKEDGNLSDYDFFDYKSYGLETTDYRKGYINNFFVVGAPSIANGSVVSGFSTSNYLRLPQTPDFSSVDSWEWAFKITTGTGTSDQQLIGGLSIDRTGVEIGIISSKLKLWLGSTSTSNSHDISTNNAVIGTYEIATSTDYWIKLSFTGTKYILSVSENGVSYTDDITVESTLRIRSENLSIGVDKYGGNRPFLGSIDLSECYIKSNGEYLWNPYKRCKYDYNFTTVGTPNISNAPTCEVSGFSSANYLSLPENFDVSDGSTWEMVYKVRTGSDISTGQSICGHTGSGNADPVFIGISKSKFQMTLSKDNSTNIFSISAGIATVEANTDYFIKVTFDGSIYILSYSKDGVDYIEDSSYTSSTPVWVSNLAIGRQQGADSEYPWLGSIDLTQSYIKINNQLWWSCFKQSDHLSFDEKGSDEDYDFINTKRHFLRYSTKRYYKIVPWEQPILTSNTSYGVVTGSSYSGSRYYYCISDGKIPTTNDASDNWGTNNTAIGWVNWTLEEEILIKGIKIYNRSHTTAVDYTLTGARFYTDSTKTTPIGEEFEILTSQGIYELTTIPEEGIKTNNIYFYKTGSTYSGIGELEITADKVVQSTYKDWDFYETIREVRKFYKNVSDYTYTATSGWSNVSNVFDGSADTYATCGTATDYIEIDFGKEVYIDSFVATGNWVDSVARAEDLRLYTVDDSDIETLVAQSTGAVGTTTYTTSASFNRVKTSKIRFKLSETNNEGNPPTTQYPTRIREININSYCESDSSDYDFYKLEEEKNIVYNTRILKINPTPSYATVTINGEVTNSVTVLEGSEVSYEVSLEGYVTQSGTVVVNEDTVLDVVLEEKPPELSWACYTDGNSYFYVQPPFSVYSIWGQGIGGQVSNSSEIDTGQMLNGEIFTVDETRLVIWTESTSTQEYRRYYEGDLYE